MLRPDKIESRELLRLGICYLDDGFLKTLAEFRVKTVESATNV